MRLIDADRFAAYIENGLADTLPDFHTDKWRAIAVRLAKDFVQDIKDQPTIDPIHAAGGCYCRECVHFKPHPDNKFRGDKWFICDSCPLNTEYAPFVKPDDFCKWGKPREEVEMGV